MPPANNESEKKPKQNSFLINRFHKAEKRVVSVESSFSGRKRTVGIVLWFITGLVPFGFLGCIHLALGWSKIAMREKWLFSIVYF